MRGVWYSREASNCACSERVLRPSRQRWRHAEGGSWNCPEDPVSFSSRKLRRWCNQVVGSLHFPSFREKKIFELKPAFETAAAIVPPKYDVLPVLCPGPGILQPVILLSRIFLFYRARYMKCKENAGVSFACAELSVHDIFDRTYRAELRYWIALQDVADCWPKKIMSAVRC
ncbi:unnamed protein product [Ixodes pacificus]